MLLKRRLCSLPLGTASPTTGAQENTMYQRDCLKLLAELGATLALPAASIATASDIDINIAWCDLLTKEDPYQDEHPRIASLRNKVLSLPVDGNYKVALFQSIVLYRDQILERPVYTHEVGLDDLTALQQVTLGDLNEQWFSSLLNFSLKEHAAK